MRMWSGVIAFWSDWDSLRTRRLLSCVCGPLFGRDASFPCFTHRLSACLATGLDVASATWRRVSEFQSDIDGLSAVEAVVGLLDGEESPSRGVVCPEKSLGESRWRNGTMERGFGYVLEVMEWLDGIGRWDGELAPEVRQLGVGVAVVTRIECVSGWAEPSCQQSVGVFECPDAWPTSPDDA